MKDEDLVKMLSETWSMIIKNDVCIYAQIFILKVYFNYYVYSVKYLDIYLN